MLRIKRWNVCVIFSFLCLAFLVLKHLLPSWQGSNKSSLSPLPRCTDKGPARYLVVVTSTDEDDRRRNVYRDGPMRHTWTSCHGTKLDITWRFSLQYTSTLYEGYLPYRLSLESETHGDIIEDVKARHTRAPLHVLQGLVARYDWDYLVSISDRTLIDPGALVGYLPGARSVYYGGLVVRQGASPLHYTAPEGTSPLHYTSPDLTILSRPGALNLLAGSRFVGPASEHVSMGRTARLLHLTPQHIGRGYNGSVSQHAVYVTDLGRAALRAGFADLVQSGNTGLLL